MWACPLAYLMYFSPRAHILEKFGWNKMCFKSAIDRKNTFKTKVGVSLHLLKMMGDWWQGLVIVSPCWWWKKSSQFKIIVLIWLIINPEMLPSCWLDRILIQISSCLFNPNSGHATPEMRWSEIRDEVRWKDGVVIINIFISLIAQGVFFENKGIYIYIYIYIYI